MATNQYTNDIQKLYVAYFNRPADPGGLAYWEGVVEASNGDTTVVSADFAKSAEYKATYAGMTNEQIVDAVYQNLFGRPADAAGKAFYAGFLKSGALTIDKVVTEVANGAQGNSDGQIYANKVSAASAFTAALNTDAEIAGYTTASAPLAKAFLAGITTGASLDAAIAPAALNASVGEVVAAGAKFDLLTALDNLNTATDAETAYLKSITDADATATITSAEVATALTTATTEFQTAFATQNATAATAYSVATSAAVKAAIINDQVSANTEKLAADQKSLNEVNAKIAAVSGLATAVSRLDTATTAKTDADKAAATADTALAGAKASFATTAATKIGAVGGTLTVDVTKADAVYLDAATDTVLITKGTDGTFKLATGVTEKDYAGVTALLSSVNADFAAHTAATNAAAVVVASKTSVDKLDVDSSEATALTALKTAGNFTSTPNSVQIADKATSLQTAATAEADPAGPAHAALASYTSAVTAYDTAVKVNPLYASYTIAKGAVTTDTDAITDFNDALTALHTAQQHVADLEGFDASIAAAQSLFVANDYNLEILDATSLISQTASASSDVFVVGADTKAATSISLFGLQGNDAISIGEGFTVNTGKVATAGNDAVLELFVNQVGSDTVLSVEKSAFGSNAATPEIVKITLVGVTSTDVHLDSHGIITVGTPAAA